MRIRDNLIRARRGVHSLCISFCPIEEGEVGDGDGPLRMQVRISSIFLSSGSCVGGGLSVISTGVDLPLLSLSLELSLGETGTTTAKGLTTGSVVSSAGCAGG